MNILVSNDDGIWAKGLHVLTEALAAVPGNRVYVSAPDGQRSACGHGISMLEPLRTTREKWREPYGPALFPVRPPTA